MSHMSNPEIFQNPKSGSIKVSGEYSIVDEQGNEITKATDPKLCGCGLSQDKPFCDKSHANYVAIVAGMLEDARAQRKAMLPMGVWALRAFEIRKRTLEKRMAAGEKLLGVKFGGALLKSKTDQKSYEGIFGFLTDAMQVKDHLELSTLIAPIAEAEVVFKLGRDLNQAITIEEVLDYVSEVAPGIEVFDCRYGAIDPYIDDAVADNACAGAFAIGAWVDAKSVNLIDSKIEIFVDGKLDQSVPATQIAGNPWQAFVNVSKCLASAGVSLPACSIIFSGSATSGIVMKPGKYKVAITQLGEVEFEASFN